MKISNTIDIACTVDDVFSWLKNPDKSMEWMSSVSKTEILLKTPNMVGTTFRETIEEDGRSTELHGSITDYKENQLIGFHLDGQYTVVDVTFALQQLKNGSRLTHNANIRFKSYLRIISYLMWPFFKKKIIAQSQKEYLKLKELCEKIV